ncbi:hypothetical protein I7I51_05354, partial [Histoplasma capsulatum]
ANMLNDFCILRAAREYLCDQSTTSPDQRDVLLVIYSPDEIIPCWASSTILSQSSAIFADLTTKKHEIHLVEENIQEMLLILYSLHYQWWKQPNQERIPTQVGLDAVSKHTLNHLSRKYQLMPTIVPFMAFIYKSLSSDFRRDVEALQLALTEGWQTHFQEFHRIAALCVQYLRPGTEVLRLVNAFIPGSLPERIEKEIRTTKQKLLNLLETARQKLKSDRCSYKILMNNSADGFPFNVGFSEIAASNCNCCCPLFRVEYYCDDYLALVQQSWYDRSIADITGCFQRRAANLKKLHKCSAGVYCPLIQVVLWLVNQSYIIQKTTAFPCIGR